MPSLGFHHVLKHLSKQYITESSQLVWHIYSSSQSLLNELMNLVLYHFVISFNMILKPSFKGLQLPNSLYMIWLTNINIELLVMSNNTMIEVLESSLNLSKQCSTHTCQQITRHNIFGSLPHYWHMYTWFLVLPNNIILIRKTNFSSVLHHHHPRCLKAIKWQCIKIDGTNQGSIQLWQHLKLRYEVDNNPYKYLPLRSF